MVTTTIVVVSDAPTIIAAVVAHRHLTRCYSCMSLSYRSIWQQLFQIYFPPKNFTDQCREPGETIGWTLCDSACYTIVERQLIAGGKCWCTGINHKSRSGGWGMGHLL
jgi:hypothetical protein